MSGHDPQRLVVGGEDVAQVRKISTNAALDGSFCFDQMRDRQQLSAKVWHDLWTRVRVAKY